MEPLCPSLFASLTVCLTGKLLISSSRKELIAQKQNRHQTPKPKNIEDKNFLKIVGIHYGRDTILAEHWSCKQACYSKKWLVGHFLLPCLFLPYAYLNCPFQSTSCNSYYFIVYPLFREYLLGIIQICELLTVLFFSHWDTLKK